MLFRSGGGGWSPGKRVHLRPHNHCNPRHSAPRFSLPLISAHRVPPCQAHSRRRINADPIYPRRHPPAGPLPFSSLQGLAPAHCSSSDSETLPPEPLPLRSPRALTSNPHPSSHSSPISFSLTLGGKLAIYGAPSDSGGAMRTQRQRRERRAPRGVTRAGSLPVPGTEGRGGAVAAASADCPGKTPGGLGPNYGVKHRQ